MTAPAHDRPSTRTYLVSYNFEYGYVLEHGSKQGFPDIAASERPMFDAFFAESNLATLVGKRIYCRCEIVGRIDSPTARIVKAKLFAR